jgi:transposase
MTTTKMTEKTIEELLTEIAELRSEKERLEHQIEILQKTIFGSRSEKKVLKTESENDAQMSLFDEAETECKKEEIKEEVTEETITVPEHTRKKKRGRDMIMKDLPVEEVVHKVEDRVCNKCGTEMKPIGVEFLHDELVYVPAKMYRRRHSVETVKCPCCGKKENEDEQNEKNNKEQFRKGNAPKMMIPGSFCSPELLAHIIYSKYSNAVPLYRQEMEFKQKGVILSRTTMANWIIRMSAEKAEKIYALMKEDLLKSEVIHADETRVQVLHEKDRKAKTKSFMWVFTNPSTDQNEITLYKYSPTRHGANANEFLGEYSGYIVCDGYDGYNRVTKAIRCGCWVHARRKFIDSLPKDKALYKTSAAAKAVEYINRLFALEREYEGKNSDGKIVGVALSSDEKMKQRKTRSKAVADEFFEWIITVDSTSDTQLNKAIRYVINEKKYLMRFLENPNVDISNNRAENAVRPFVIGRKNWLFSDSTKGVDASAAWYSIIYTAYQNGLNVEQYLTELFESDTLILPYKKN